MKKTVVCKSSELKVGEKRTFKVGQDQVLIFHLKDGFYGTENLCPHTLGPLRYGKIEKGSVIRCPLHRARFDIKTGKVLNWANFPPGIQVLNVVRDQKPLKTFKVKEEQGKVVVYH